MKRRFHIASLIASAVTLFPVLVTADVFVTNFTALNGTVGATGVWRNVTTGNDLEIPVSLTQTGGMVRPLEPADNPSDIDDGTPWFDIPGIPPFIPAVDVFNPNFSGDAINIETLGGATSVITIEFNAVVTNPVISFTDVDTQTLMTVSAPFTVVGSSGNISATATTVKPDGSSVFLFEEECAGSLRVNGEHARLVITLANSGPNPQRDDDRTAFVISTETAPIPVIPPPSGLHLMIGLENGSIQLSWPEDAGLTEIRWSPDLREWTPIPGLDPGATTMWQAPVSSLGDIRYFQGVAGGAQR